MKMRLEVLLSCMFQKDLSIIQRTNINSDVVIINQTDKDYQHSFNFMASNGSNYRANVYFTKERGLSRSRNMAIKNSQADICLLCDDDEFLYDNYADIVIDTFEQNPEFEIIAFIINRRNKKNFISKCRVGYYKALKISSIQIAFRRKAIMDKELFFNEKMGSGTGHGAGEEVKFLYDCLKSKLKILYVPLCIGELLSEDSQWFKAFNKEYFINRGWSNRMIMGTFFAGLYNIYFSLAKYRLYKEDISFIQSLYYQFKGIFIKR